MAAMKISTSERKRELLRHLSTERGSSNTSALESVSANLCFISLAIEKKTSSTFRFVFALCNGIFHEHNNKKFRGFHIFWYTPLTVSKNLIPYSSASAWPLDVGTTLKETGRYITITNISSLTCMHIWHLKSKLNPFLTSTSQQNS